MKSVQRAIAERLDNPVPNVGHALSNRTHFLTSWNILVEFRSLSRALADEKQIEENKLRKDRIAVKVKTN